MIRFLIGFALMLGTIESPDMHIMLIGPSVGLALCWWGVWSLEHTHVRRRVRSRD